MVIQIFSCKHKKNELCNTFVNKSNKVMLLVVETPAKNVKSVCKQSNKKNFLLFNYFAKKKMKNKFKVVLNNCL